MGAIPVHHTATEDGPWDGPGAVANMPNSESTLRYCHAWVDSEGDPEAKSAYKFPHHRTNGGPANLGACRNGLARLSQADVPESDRAGIERHLRAHLDDVSTDDKSEKRMNMKTARSLTNLRQGRADWYKIKNQSETEAEVLIYDEIGYFGITAQDFIRELRDVQAETLTVRINTPGGEVFDGIAIYNALRSHPANVAVFVDGLAASIGSVIAMAGDEITMAKGSTMMIHDGHGVAIGNAADMRELAELLDKTSDNIASFYADRAGGTVAQWRERMRAETWYTAEEAVKAGLADKVASQTKKADKTAASWDLSIFNYSGRENAPDPVMEEGGEPDDAGFAWNPDEFRRAMKEASS